MKKLLIFLFSLSLPRQLFKKSKILRGSVHRNDRFGGVHRAWGHIFSNHLEGSYVEFGVYKGDGIISSLFCHAEFIGWLNEQKVSDEKWRRELANKSPLNVAPTFHCLDTYSGMPENDEGAINFEHDTFNTDFETVKERIKNNNPLNCKIIHYQGLFKDTSAQLKENIKKKSIAIANIDCDLMESTVDALEAIKDNIDIGTVLLFDDYNAFNSDQNKGQRKAFSDFQKDSNFVFEKFYTYHYSGQAFLVIGKAEDL